MAMSDFDLEEHKKQWAEVQSEVKNNSNDAFQHMLDVNSKSNEAVCGRCNRTYYRSSAGCPQCDGASYGLRSYLYQENEDCPVQSEKHDCWN